MELRDYQRDAVDSIYEWFGESSGNPLIVVPTGGGKSVIIGEFIRELLEEWPGERVMVATHVKELVEQNYNTFVDCWGGIVCCPAGIYSAGLKRRDTRSRVLFAGVQSVYRRAAQFGHVDLLLVDEAHLIPPKGFGMYRQLIDGLRSVNPNLKLIGFTATPFRTDTGSLDKGDDRMFHGVAYECSIPAMIEDGWLSPVTNQGVAAEIDTSNVHIRGGEFIPGELEDAATEGDLVQRSVEELIRRAGDRKKWLVFCCGVEHANQVAEELERQGVTNHTVFGETHSRQRDKRVDDFRAGRVRAMVNCNVLTTGFDVPDVDLIALMRPTQSPGLYVQMVGRGLRIAEDKEDCVVLDFGGNVCRHGPIDAVEVKEHSGSDGEPPMKKCPQCMSISFAAVTICPTCGFVFPVRRGEANHDERPDEHSEILSGQRKPIERWAVTAELFREHTKHNAPADHPKTLRVYYDCGYKREVSEWVCFEHAAGSFPRRKAERWWRERGGNMPAPETVDLARVRIELGETKRALEIIVDTRGEFPEIKGTKLEHDEDHARRNEDRAEPAPTPDYDDIPF